MTALERAIELKPLDIETLSNRTLCFLNLEKYSEAKECCEKIIRISPNCGVAWIHKGFALLHLKKYEETKIRFKKGAKIDSHYMELFNEVENVLATKSKRALSIQLRIANKNMKKAMLLASIPGLLGIGHLYVGRRIRAAIYMIIGLFISLVLISSIYMWPVAPQYFGVVLFFSGIYFLVWLKQIFSVRRFTNEWNYLTRERIKELLV